MQVLISHIHNLGPPLYRFFLARCRRQEAEDLVQEVFTRLAVYPANRFALTKGSVEALAWGIAQNVQREQLRALKRVEECPEIIVRETTEMGEENFALREAVAKLHEPEREIVSLLLADLPISQISQLLKMPEGTVKSHLHRSKEKLKIFLSEGSSR